MMRSSSGSVATSPGAGRCADHPDHGADDKGASSLLHILGASTTTCPSSLGSGKLLDLPVLANENEEGTRQHNDDAATPNTTSTSASTQAQWCGVPTMPDVLHYQQQRNHASPTLLEHHHALLPLLGHHHAPATLLLEHYMYHALTTSKAAITPTAYAPATCTQTTSVVKATSPSFAAATAVGKAPPMIRLPSLWTASPVIPVATPESRSSSISTTFSIDPSGGDSANNGQLYVEDCSIEQEVSGVIARICSSMYSVL